MTSYSSFSLVNHLAADVYCYGNHKYVNIHRHQLFILSEINNGWSMTVTVLQRKASTQQISLLLVPATTVITSLHLSTLICILSSQPELNKLYNQNTGGHHYTFTITLTLNLIGSCGQQHRLRGWSHKSCIGQTSSLTEHISCCWKHSLHSTSLYLQAERHAVIS